MRVECTCEQCGQSFRAYAFLNRRFCSRSCRSRWVVANVPRRRRSAPRVTIPCPICAAAMTMLASRAKRNPTCSPACLKALKQRVQRRGEHRTCATCGGPFYFTASRAREGQAGLFCSIPCRDQRPKAERRASATRNSADYRDWRLAVYRRDDYTCQRCGKRGGHDLHAHHIKGWTRYPGLRFELSNGMTLCNPCHVAWHQEHGWR